MRQTAEMIKHTCDGCSRTRVTDADDEPNGFHGAVRQVTDLGGTGTVEYYACSTRCIGKAVTNALSSVERAGESGDLDVDQVDADSADLTGVTPLGFDS